MTGLELRTATRLWRCLAVLLLPWCAQVISAWGLSHEGILPCIFKIQTGLPCFLCGGTHAVMHLLAFDLALAMQDNAAVSLICLGLLVYGALLLLESVRGHRFFHPDVTAKILAWAVRVSGLALLMNWAIVLHEWT